MMNDQLWERVLYCFIKIRSVKVTYIGCFLLDLDCLILYHTVDSGYKVPTIDLKCMLLIGDVFNLLFSVFKLAAQLQGKRSF